MSTFVELSERLDFLTRKSQLFDFLKTKVEDLLEDGNDEDKAALNDILLDLDEKCVAPLIDEISSIKAASLTKRAKKTTEKKDVKVKEERKPAKKTSAKYDEKKKAGTKPKRAKASNTRKRSR